MPRVTHACEDTGPIAAMAAAARTMTTRPVDAWHPTHCGNSNMVILSDGRWLHEGRPIRRPELVQLFSSILRREPEGGYVLVTPAEKLAIAVEDAPFVAVEAASEGDGPARRIAFRLNTEELVEAGPDHAISLRGGRPYLAVRGGLEARIERAVYYELAEMALLEGGSPPGLWSRGAYFPLG